MRTTLGIIASLIAMPALAENAEVKWPDCYCTDRAGSRIELGQMVCMQVDGRSYMAQCQMSQNNPMWREVGEECLTSRLPQSFDPSLNASAINAKISLSITRS